MHWFPPSPPHPHPTPPHPADLPPPPPTHPHPHPTPQTSKIQFWVVKQQGGGQLTPYAVRYSTTGAGELPSADSVQQIEK